MEKIHATGTFAVAKWEETALPAFGDAMPASRASIVYEATGEIIGRFDVEYILHTTRRNPEDPHDAEASYLGYMLFTGALGGHKGTFVLEDHGIYAGGLPVSELAIKPGTGTGGFAGITGGGRYFARDGKMVMELDCALP